MCVCVSSVSDPITSVSTSSAATSFRLSRPTPGAAAMTKDLPSAGWGLKICGLGVTGGAVAFGEMLAACRTLVAG